MKQSRNKNHSESLGGIVCRVPGKRTKKLSARKEHGNPCAPSNYTCCQNTAGPGLHSCGGERERFQLQGKYGSECNCMVFINTSISFKEKRETCFQGYATDLGDKRHWKDEMCKEITFFIHSSF